jgi:hypothetical protein
LRSGGTGGVLGVGVAFGAAPLGCVAGAGVRVAGCAGAWVWAETAQRPAISTLVLQKRVSTGIRAFIFIADSSFLGHSNFNRPLWPTAI